MRHRLPAVWPALAAAGLFGASTPFVKLLVGELPALLLAGLLYLGSGLGLAAVRLLRDRGWQASGIAAGEWRWFGAAIVFGGMLGPALLVFGLTRIDAGPASLLLNLEAVFTALLAWLVFRENADRRIVLGMAVIVVGGAVLAWPSATYPAQDALGLLAIAAACLCWAIDNNLTRRVSNADALFVAGTKGLTAGAVNTSIAWLMGASLPAWTTVGSIMTVGLLGYGLSLVLFVRALRELGTARTGAYFSTAPFLGATLSIALLNEPTTPLFWLAACLMGIGVWLHLTEVHAHEHMHEPLDHAHRHVHDPHHQHAHDFDWDGGEPHSHPHHHTPLIHSHPHYPDIHHRHPH